MRCGVAQKYSGNQGNCERKRKTENKRKNKRVLKLRVGDTGFEPVTPSV